MKYLSIISYFLSIFCLLTFTLISCGVFVQEPTPVRVIVERKPGGTTGGGDKAYAFADIIKTCTSCHNGSAPEIPLEEDAFKKSSNVKDRILDGTMPPAGGLDLDKVKKYFEG